MKTLRVLLLALSVLSARAALAGETNTALVNQVAVSYAGLDLSSQNGAATLYRRIRVAAQSVCKELYTLTLGQRRHKWDLCVRDAIARAVLNVNAPALTAYTTARIGDLGNAVAIVASK